MFIKNIFNNLKAYSYLMSQMIGRDFKIKYKRSILGIIWSLLYPLLMMIVMAIVFSRVFKFQVPGLNYLVYLLSGIVMFNYFSDATNTAMTSENDYKDAMIKMIDNNYDEIIVITLASALSGTYNSAIKAAEAIDKKRIHVIDGSVTVLNGILIMKAVELIKAGKNTKQVIKEIKNTIRNQHAVFSVSDLDFLKRGGRISSIQSIVGGVFDIKPILTLTSERGLVFIDKAKGDNQLIRKFIKYVKYGRNKKNPLTIAYAGKYTLPKAFEFQKKLEEALNEKVEFLIEISAVIGTHTGPGLLGIIY